MSLGLISLRKSCLGAAFIWHETIMEIRIGIFDHHLTGGTGSGGVKLRSRFDPIPPARLH